MPDCSNGEDEQGCAVTCDATQYLCKNTMPVNDSAAHSIFQHYHNRDCIGIKHVCDGVPDCPENDGDTISSKNTSRLICIFVLTLVYLIVFQTR